MALMFLSAETAPTTQLCKVTSLAKTYRSISQSGGLEQMSQFGMDFLSHVGLFHTYIPTG